MKYILGEEFVNIPETDEVNVKLKKVEVKGNTYLNIIVNLMIRST
jgi:hypothetical protein